MIVKNITIDVYGWKLEAVFKETNEDYDNVVTHFKSLKIPKSSLKSIKDTIENDTFNGGLHLYDNFARSTKLVFSEFSNTESKVEVVSHEIRHAVDNILKWLAIKDKEAAAFLTGYITSKILTI